MTTLTATFGDTFAAHAGRPATRVRGRDGWVEQTFAELDAAADRGAGGLVAAGVQPGERVVIWSQNRPEWTEADLAIMRAGAVSVPVYPSSTPEQLRHIVADSGAVMIILEGATEAEKLAEVRGALPEVRTVVAFDPTPGAEPWAGLGTDDHRDEVRRRAAATRPGDLVSVIYTSGTTGAPRGVMLTHAAFVAELRALDAFLHPEPTDHSLCFLPLSHALERGWTYYILSHGCRNTYLHDPKAIADALVETRPTLFVSVPRLYEKVYAVAKERVAGSRLKRRIFVWALSVGGRLQHAYRSGQPAPLSLRLALPVADRLVLRAIRRAVGGPKTVLASGGAPLRKEIEEFFAACGLLILQGYGMTEAAPLISFNSPGAFKFGTVGRVMAGGELRAGPEGEIWYRGPNVMAGYLGDEEATRAVLDAEGWLHTGDVGCVDDDGFLTITDRLKDLLVTSGGKNIAPQPIEGQILADPLFEHAVLLGDNRPYVTLLVKPSLPQLEELAKQLQITWSNVEELVSNQQVVDEIRRRVSAVTDRLPRHEQVKDLRVLWDDFSQENGLLTPTLKVRRREVEKRFAAVIDDMYSRVADRRGRG